MQALFGKRAFLAGMTPTLSPGLSSPTIPGSTAQGFEFVVKDMRIANVSDTVTEAFNRAENGPSVAVSVRIFRSRDSI